MKRSLFLFSVALAMFCGFGAVGGTEPENAESPAATSNYEVRTWTDHRDHKLRASFVELRDGRVTLRSEDGARTFQVPIEHLSTADKTYIRNKRREFLEKTTEEKTAAEEQVAVSGGVASLYDEDGPPIPAGFTNRFRSPFTAARSVAYSDDGREILVWKHDNGASLWDNRTGCRLKFFKGNTSGSEVVAFGDDGRVNVAGAGNDVLIKDTLTGNVLKTLKGHTGLVTPVALSPDGRLALSGSADKTAMLWDVETGSLKHRLEGHSGRVLSVAFHPKGLHVLTGDDEGNAIQWSVQTGRAVKRYDKIGGPINSVSYNRDGAVAMLIAPSTAMLWDTFVQLRQSSASSGSGERSNPVIGKKAALALVSPGDRLVYDGSFDSVAFSGDNRFFMLVSKIGNVYIGNLQTQTWVRKIERLESGVNRAAFNDDASEYLTVSFNDNAIFWGGETGDKIAEFKGYNYCVSPIRMTRDGRRILTSGSWADPTVAIWDTRSGTLLKRLTGHRTAVRHIDVLPNGKRVLTVSFEPFDEQRHGENAPSGRRGTFFPKRHVILWDISTGKPLIEVQDAVGWALAPNGTQLITATGRRPDEIEGNVIRFWDTHTGRKIRETEMKHGNIGHDFLFYPDGNRILAKRGESAFNWVARSGKEAGIFRSLQYDLWTARFAPGGKMLFCASEDGKGVLWNLLKDAPEKEFGGHGGAVLSVAVSPDGKHALTGSTDKTAILWDAQSGVRIKTLTAGDASVVGVEFTEDGKLAMVASEDGIVVFHGL